MTPPDAAPVPRFRRPTRADAIDVARELLDRGDRVDVQAVARHLGVSRATLHRWFGTRDALMSALFEHMAIEFREASEAGARGRGDDRAFDFVRRMAESSAAYAPLRVAATREPGVVLRLVLAEGGPVHEQFAGGFTELLAASRTPREMRALAETIGIFTRTALALHWAAIAAGGDPDPRDYERIGRALLADAQRGRAGAR